MQTGKIFKICLHNEVEELMVRLLVVLANNDRKRDDKVGA